MSTDKAQSGAGSTGEGARGPQETQPGESAPRSKGFKAAHLSMMALGSAIGAGFFLGTGVAVSEAGPAVLVSYILAALIVVTVMYALAELAAAIPSSGSFSTYAEAGIGRWAGFTSGWLYWFMLIMVLGLEMTGAAQIFTAWFPSVDQWVVTLVIVVVLGGINLLAAGEFGRVEAWLAGLKVAAIIFFLVVGLGLLVGIIPGRAQSLHQAFVGNGGFAPAGLPGIAVGLLAIITSFGGLEIVTIAAAEADDARRAMSQAIRSVIWRILVFYVGSVALLICLLPWNSDEMKTSPFAAVLNMAGIPAVGMIMEIIVFTALISAFSANIYASSRIAYSLSARGMGPTWILGARVRNAVDEGDEALGVTTLHGDIEDGRTPRRSVAVSVALAFISVALNWYLPSSIMQVLINAVGMVLLIVWVMIVISQIRLHSKLEAEGVLSLRMPGWPWLPWFAVIGLVSIAVLMMFNAAGRAQLVAMGSLTLILVCLYFARENLRNRKARREWRLSRCCLCSGSFHRRSAYSEFSTYSCLFVSRSVLCAKVAEELSEGGKC